MVIKYEWFAGNKDAVEIYQLMCGLADTWDNLIDKDKEVSNEQINDMFITCLYRLPMNPLYKHMQDHISPMWMTVISSYEAANKFEREHDEHGIELAHTLRYSAGHIIAYLILFCVGVEKSREYIPEMWKTFANERFEKYRSEHIKTEKTNG